MAKSRNIIAIGGGGFGANPGQGIIEEYILKQTKKNVFPSPAAAGRKGNACVKKYTACRRRWCLQAHANNQSFATTPRFLS